MKKLIIALLLAVVLTLGIGGVAFADPGSEDVDVVASGIIITGGLQTGNTINLSGVITITATAEAGGGGFFSWYTADASSSASYIVTNPDGGTVATGASSVIDSDIGWWFVPADADASQTYNWSADVYLDQAGNWTATHSGIASAEWADFFLWWQTAYGEDFDIASLTITFTVVSPTVVSPQGVSDGKGKEFIVYCNGNRGNFPWLEPEGWRNGETIAEDSTFDWVIGTHQYRLVIPEGTVVTGYNGQQVYFLRVSVYNGSVCFSPSYIYFSQPVVLLEFADGEWVEFLTFNQIVGGQPKLVASTAENVPTD